MVEFVSTIPVPTSLQELDQAIQRYRSSELSGSELHHLWQAIRELSLEQIGYELASDRVPGDHSY
ncbi:MAG TPA: hypothetical protein V6D18_12215 [Thermosynechococcaceae cyanobacterium]